MKQKIETYDEIRSIEAKTQQDYLMKYIAAQVAYDKYKESREDLDLPVGGFVTQDDKEYASKAAVAVVNGIGWQSTDDSRVRHLRNIIHKFFSALEIDTTIFKSSREYKMTESLSNLFDYILDHEKDISSRIIKRVFSKVPLRDFSYIYQIVVRAIKDGPCTEQEKESAIHQFISFAKQNQINLFQAEVRNDIVDGILSIVWSSIKELSWVPTKSDALCGFEDPDWQIITEKVYQALLKYAILIPPTDDSAFNLKYRLAFDTNIPPEVRFKL